MEVGGVRSACAAATIVAATLGTTRLAHADIQVERSASADACPDAEAFLQLIRARGDDGGGATSTDITVRFERTTDGFRSSVRVADGPPRSLVDDAPSCDGLAEATALAVKLTLDLDAARPSAVKSTPDATPKPPPPAGDLPPVAEARPRTLGELSLSGVVAVGLASPVAAGARAGAAVVLDRRGHWTLGLGGLVLPAQSTDIADGTVHVSVQGGGLEACGRAPIGQAALLALCGRAEALRIAGESRGFDRTERQARATFTSAGLARARARVAGPIAVFLELGVIVPLVRQRFAIDTVGVVYDPPLVAGAAGIGAVVDFE
ncbi:MAG: hypothetical protein KF894_26790 [Labilithrix sp.]|nr:hypothetical protein [Labilithrix sp.]